MEDDAKNFASGEFYTDARGKVPPLVTTKFITRDMGNSGMPFLWDALSISGNMLSSGAARLFCHMTLKIYILLIYVLYTFIIQIWCRSLVHPVDYVHCSRHTWHEEANGGPLRAGMWTWNNLQCLNNFNLNKMCNLRYVKWMAFNESVYQLFIAQFFLFEMLRTLYDPIYIGTLFNLASSYVRRWWARWVRPRMESIRLPSST